MIRSNQYCPTGKLALKKIHMQAIKKVEKSSIWNIKLLIIVCYIFFEIASNSRNMQMLGQKEICTSNHTCNQQMECKIFLQATQKSTQNG